MTDEPEPHGVGSHGLGPHVVGQRVVVRHLLPDGRATDVLGVCTAWGGGLASIDSLRGPVTVRIADIVSGKPVPPRASVRHRVSPRDVELHVASLWPMTTEHLGTWVLRVSPPIGGRLRRRGNSALVMAEPGLGLGLADAAASVRAFYASVGQKPLLQVEAGSDLERALAPLGFIPLGDGDAFCQLAPVSRALRAAGRGTEAGRLTESGETCVVEVHDGAVVARGQAALDGDWLGLHGLEVDPARRREGLGGAVLAELLDWGASRGATTAWLHVETDNDAALATYARLGFVTHHTSRYLRG